MIVSSRLRQERKLRYLANVRTANAGLYGREVGSDASKPEFEDDESEDGASPHVTSGSPTPEPQESSLEEAILSAPLWRVQRLLIDICKINDYARAYAAGSLHSDMIDGKKRKKSEMCKHCGKEYEVEHNQKGGCKYHSGVSRGTNYRCIETPGRKKVDAGSGIWDDHDPNINGDLEDFADDPDYASGFVWLCCDKAGGGKPCVWSRHKPCVDERGVKRARYS
ncbi:hypothetical protein LTR37_016432 [Vermiconidia calcicola]|uniref:Uncharacterized protein n=1 Tax=Vermiconidia calcicola TaxID=1690605 RepID=A0ACC3MMR0_9PEZI|nr:hypothetical protein LTR37_016432 [Vermiconidia calcicola]